MTISKINIPVTAEQARAVMDERSNGCVHIAWDSDGHLESLFLDGEFCAEDLEAVLVFCATKLGKDKTLIDPSTIEVTTIEHRSPTFNVVNERYGLTPNQAYSYRLADQTIYKLTGMSASKGGRVWISDLTDIKQLQALCCELQLWCDVRDYKVSRIEDCIGLED